MAQTTCVVGSKWSFEALRFARALEGLESLGFLGVRASGARAWQFEVHGGKTSMEHEKGTLKRTVMHEEVWPLALEGGYGWG